MKKFLTFFIIGLLSLSGFEPLHAWNPFGKKKDTSAQDEQKAEETTSFVVVKNQQEPAKSAYQADEPGPSTLPKTYDNSAHTFTEMRALIQKGPGELSTQLKTPQDWALALKAAVSLQPTEIIVQTLKEAILSNLPKDLGNAPIKKALCLTDNPIMVRILIAHGNFDENSLQEHFLQAFHHKRYQKAKVLLDTWAEKNNCPFTKESTQTFSSVLAQSSNKTSLDDIFEALKTNNSPDVLAFLKPNFAEEMSPNEPADKGTALDTIPSRSTDTLSSTIPELPITTESLAHELPADKMLALRKSMQSNRGTFKKRINTERDWYQVVQWAACHSKPTADVLKTIHDGIPHIQQPFSVKKLVNLATYPESVEQLLLDTQNDTETYKEFFLTAMKQQNFAKAKTILTIWDSKVSCGLSKTSKEVLLTYLANQEVPMQEYFKRLLINEETPKELISLFEPLFSDEVQQSKNLEQCRKEKTDKVTYQEPIHYVSNKYKTLKKPLAQKLAELVKPTTINQTQEAFCDSDDELDYVTSTNQPVNHKKSMQQSTTLVAFGQV